jgi:RNA polymerase sigma-70 factor (ECF subfamily)
MQVIIFCSVADQKEDYGHKHNKLKIDETIFKKIAEEDQAAFEKLYQITERSVYSLALSILRNHDDAMDVVQDTYLKIRSAAHLYIPMGKPLAWIFTITRNLAMSEMRLQKKSDRMQLEDLEDSLSFSYVTDSEDKLVLKAALSVLDMQEREIILLHAVSGFKHREIAADLNLPLSTVLSKYSRGLDKLKKHLKE